ncbi:MAG: arginase [Bdellovibrionota bacterium]
MCKLQLIAAGIGIGQDLAGVENGPEAWFDFFREHYPRLLYVPPEASLIKNNLSSVHLHNNKDSQSFPFAVYDQLAQQVANSQRRGFLPVTLGGDHSVAMGSITGSLQAQPNMKVVWVDAHGDINTPETTLTGRVHGMPLAYLLGLWAQDRFRLRLHEKNVALFGIRDLDSGEKKIIRDLGIKAVSQSEISRRGINKCWQEVSEHLNLANSPVHVSFDVDAMDPKLFPYTGVPVNRGLNGYECEILFHKISQLKNLRAIDIVEFNPLVNIESGGAVDGRHLVGQFLNSLTQPSQNRAQLKRISLSTTSENMAWPNLA